MASLWSEVLPGVNAKAEVESLRSRSSGEGVELGSAVGRVSELEAELEHEACVPTRVCRVSMLFCCVTVPPHPSQRMS